MIARVFPYSSKPEYSLRSQRPSFMLWPAAQIGRAREPIRKHVSSQAEIELPPGVLEVFIKVNYLFLVVLGEFYPLFHIFRQ
jgi:hypothetical protein